MFENHFVIFLYSYNKIIKKENDLVRHLVTHAPALYQYNNIYSMSAYSLVLGRYLYHDVY